MNVNINNKNLFSQSLLINKFFFQKNSSHKQTGITTVDSGCQYRNNNYYYNKDGVPFLSKEQDINISVVAVILYLRINPLICWREHFNHQCSEHGYQWQ